MQATRNIYVQSCFQLSTQTSLYQAYRPSPFAFFVMTTKKLLDDVNILKKGNLETNMGKRKFDETHVDGDSEVEGADEKQSREYSMNLRRQSTASARLSYSSTSTSSSSAESQFPSPEFRVPDFLNAPSNAEAPHLDRFGSVFCTGSTGVRGSSISVTRNDDTALGEKDDVRVQPSNLEGDQSPVNTSFESEFNTNSDISKNSSNKSNSLKALRRSNRNARGNITS